VRRRAKDTNPESGCVRGFFGLSRLPLGPLRVLLAGRALRELDRRAWQAADPREFVERALRWVAWVLGADGVCLVQPAAGDGRLRAVAGCGLPVGLELPRDGLAARAMRTGTALLAGPLERREPDLPRSLRARGYRGGLVAAVPGVREARGAIGAVFRRRRRPARWALAFLEDVARRVGSVLERWEAAEALERSVHYDPVTGLPNRRLLFRHLERRLAEEAPGGLAFLDVEDFEEVSDAWGFDAGDVLLRELARRLGPERARGAWVAHCGAARFALVFRGAPEAGRVERALARLERPLTCQGVTVRLVARAGLVRFPEHGRDAATLLRRAGLALAEARSRGVRLAEYRPGLEGARGERAQVERLRAALREGGAIELRFQPIVDLEQGRTVYLEALARWRDPGSGRAVPPERFVALAERHGLARDLDRAVFTGALAVAERLWRELGERAPRVTVNVAPASLADPGFVDFVAGAVRGLPPHKRPVLELTERSLADAEAANAALARLHAVGVQVFVDDLGAGYAALSTLAAMQVDGFKVDRALTAAVPGDERARTVVRAMLRLGRELGLPVVVEGVENGRQLAWLRSEGCRLAQGYALGRPQDVARLFAAMRAERAEPAPRTPASARPVTMTFQPVWLDL